MSDGGQTVAKVILFARSRGIVLLSLLSVVGWFLGRPKSRGGGGVTEVHVLIDECFFEKNECRSAGGYF